MPPELTENEHKFISHLKLRTRFFVTCLRMRSLGKIKKKCGEDIKIEDKLSRRKTSGEKLFPRTFRMHSRKVQW